MIPNPKSWWIGTVRVSFCKVGNVSVWSIKVISCPAVINAYHRHFHFHCALSGTHIVLSLYHIPTHTHTHHLSHSLCISLSCYPINCLVRVSTTLIRVLPWLRTVRISVWGQMICIYDGWTWNNLYWSNWHVSDFAETYANGSNPSGFRVWYHMLSFTFSHTLYKILHSTWNFTFHMFRRHNNPYRIAKTFLSLSKFDRAYGF